MPPWLKQLDVEVVPLIVLFSVLKLLATTITPIRLSTITMPTQTAMKQVAVLVCRR